MYTYFQNFYSTILLSHAFHVLYISLCKSRINSSHVLSGRHQYHAYSSGMCVLLERELHFNIPSASAQAQS